MLPDKDYIINLSVLDSLSLGNVVPTDHVIKNITIQNIGTVPIELLGNTCQGRFEINYTPGTLLPNDTKEIEIKFQPLKFKYYEEFIKLVTDKGLLPLGLVSGTGYVKRHKNKHWVFYGSNDCVTFTPHIKPPCAMYNATNHYGWSKHLEFTNKTSGEEIQIRALENIAYIKESLVEIKIFSILEQINSINGIYDINDNLHLLLNSSKSTYKLVDNVLLDLGHGMIDPYIFKKPNTNVIGIAYLKRGENRVYLRYSTDNYEQAHLVSDLSNHSYGALIKVYRTDTNELCFVLDQQKIYVSSTFPIYLP